MGTGVLDREKVSERVTFPSEHRLIRCCFYRLVPVSTFQLGTTVPAQYQPRGDAPEEFRKKTKSPVQEQPTEASSQPGTVSKSETQVDFTQEPQHNADGVAADKPNNLPNGEETTTTANAPATSQVSPLAEATVDPSPEQAAADGPLKSPKPEADGKLDRGFKFPSSSPPPDEQASMSGEAVTGDGVSVDAEVDESSPTAKVPEQESEPSYGDKAEVATAEQPSATSVAEPAPTADGPVNSAQTGTTESPEEPRKPEPKKTDPDVDAAARQWLSGQKHVDDTGDSASQHSTKVLDQVLEQKAVNAADMEPAATLDRTARTEDVDIVTQESDHAETAPTTEEAAAGESGIEERAVEASQQTESVPVVEVERDEGNAVQVDEQATPESNVESGIEVQKDHGEVVLVSQGNLADASNVEEATPIAVQKEEENEGVDEANDDDDETPADSAAQTPAGSPVIPDAATSVIGGGKKKKNKKKNKK